MGDFIICRIICGRKPIFALAFVLNSFVLSSNAYSESLITTRKNNDITEAPTTSVASPTIVARTPVSFNETLEILKIRPYDYNDLPVIPIQLFKFFTNGLIHFFVADRSEKTLKDGADFRRRGQKKPIHPMGVGVTGRIDFFPTKYSGLFRGGSFPVIGRLSISQGYPLKVNEKTLYQKVTGQPASRQVRSVSLGLKVFPTKELSALDEKVITANAVFQNDLNGEQLDHFFDGVLTNQPRLNFLKIRQSYEIFTLLGVAKGAFSNGKDVFSEFPYINPQIRPVHQLAESMEDDPQQIFTPTWMKLQVKEGSEIIEKDDFRKEIVETIEKTPLVYEFFVAKDENSRDVNWELAGEITFDKTYLSGGVDENLLFFHSSLQSELTGEWIWPSHAPEPVREN